jgi:hypothetical protein
MSEEPNRIFVGTDQRMSRAERVLEYFIGEHARSCVEVHWMRAGEHGFTRWKNQPPKPCDPAR